MRITKGRESLEHERLHAVRPDLQCVFCEHLFDKKHDLMMHMESHVSKHQHEVLSSRVSFDFFSIEEW